MSDSQDSVAVEYERNVSRLSSTSGVQGLNIIPPTQSNEGEREDREAGLHYGAILIQIDGQASQSLISGEQGPTLQQNAIGIPETPPLESTPLSISDRVPILHGIPPEDVVGDGSVSHGGEVTTLLTSKERESDALLYPQKMTESSLLVTAQVFATLLTAWLGNDKNHLSFSAKILRDFAVGSTIVGYISSFSSILMCRLSTSLASRILNTAAYAGAAFGFIASMSMLLPDELRLWVAFLSCAACVPALAAAFCN